ncbi:MAG: membrane protein insertion efficiency factor YidD [Methylophilaceae bacterium]|nr:membrane protein insertion efficiency factor YidD [Methyloradius sp.]
MRKGLISVIKLYQLTLSPFFGQQCRFSPTCSQYAIEAIQKHGALHGMRYAIVRLAKCHPWHPGGHDPVS